MNSNYLFNLNGQYLRLLIFTGTRSDSSDGYDHVTCCGGLSNAVYNSGCIQGANSNWIFPEFQTAVEGGTYTMVFDSFNQAGCPRAAFVRDTFRMHGFKITQGCPPTTAPTPAPTRAPTTAPSLPPTSVPTSAPTMAPVPTAVTSSPSPFPSPAPTPLASSSPGVPTTNPTIFIPLTETPGGVVAVEQDQDTVLLWLLPALLCILLLLLFALGFAVAYRRRRRHRDHRDLQLGEGTRPPQSRSRSASRSRRQSRQVSRSSSDTNLRRNNPADAAANSSEYSASVELSPYTGHYHNPAPPGYFRPMPAPLRVYGPLEKQPPGPAYQNPGFTGLAEDPASAYGVLSAPPLAFTYDGAPAAAGYGALSDGPATYGVLEKSFVDGGYAIGSTYVDASSLQHRKQDDAYH